jgi:hypothetical protein
VNRRENLANQGVFRLILGKVPLFHPAVSCRNLQVLAEHRRNAQNKKTQPADCTDCQEGSVTHEFSPPALRRASDCICPADKRVRARLGTIRSHQGGGWRYPGYSR